VTVGAEVVPGGRVATRLNPVMPRMKGGASLFFIGTVGAECLPII
jgi:hypothetical protein